METQETVVILTYLTEQGEIMRIEKGSLTHRDMLKYGTLWTYLPDEDEIVTRNI